MFILILLVFLTGAVLGLRFKVLVLVPAMGLAILAVIATGVARGHSFPAILIAGVLALICVQIGYLGGLLTRYTTTAARVGSQRETSMQAESAP
jgi:hypothetical protein